MTQTTIREIRGDEMLDIMYGLDAYVFGSSPPLPDRAGWENVIKQREDVTYFALFEDDDAVATVAGAPMTQNVRGALFGMSGLWGMRTHPAARRE